MGKYYTLVYHSPEEFQLLTQTNKMKLIEKDIIDVHERLLKSGFTLDHKQGWTVQFQQFINSMY
jgi:hypothetical protein